VLRWYEVERIEDGSDVEPGGQNHLQNVRDVSASPSP
jgi:hypothetical protein